MLSEAEQQRFDEVCQEHIWAAVGMYVLNKASGSEQDAKAAAVSVRDLVDIAPAYRACWDRVKPIVQTQGFRAFIAIVEHRKPAASLTTAPRGGRVSTDADYAPKSPLTNDQDGELIAERVLSTDTHEAGHDSASTARSSQAPANRSRRRSVPGASGSRKTGMPLACLHVLEGRFAGRDLELNQILTQFGQDGRHSAAILRQHDGYSIVTRDGIRAEEAPLINGARIGSSARALRCDDIVEIAGIKARFVLN